MLSRLVQTLASRSVGQTAATPHGLYGGTIGLYLHYMVPTSCRRQVAGSPTFRVDLVPSDFQIKTSLRKRFGGFFSWWWPGVWRPQGTYTKIKTLGPIAQFDWVPRNSYHMVGLHPFLLDSISSCLNRTIPARTASKLKHLPLPTTIPYRMVNTDCYSERSRSLATLAWKKIMKHISAGCSLLRRFIRTFESRCYCNYSYVLLSSIGVTLSRTISHLWNVSHNIYLGGCGIVHDVDR